MRGRKPSKNRLALVGLACSVLAATIVWFGFTKDNPFDRPYELKAAFADASQIGRRAPVRIAGVNVGKVKRVEGGRGGAAVVTMEIEQGGLPIHRDATAKVRPRVFLEGNYFVELSPGTPAAPRMEDGETIPVQQTAAPVAFGQLLEALQKDTREDLRTVLQEFGTAVSGEGGRGFNRSIKFWKPAFKSSAIANDATRGILEHDLSNYLRGAARVAKGLDRDPERLKSLITDFSTTAGALASERENLSSAIDELPRTLSTGRRAFGALRTAFPSVRRLAAELEPTARSSAPALDAALPLVRELRGLMQRSELQGLVRDLRPTVPALTRFNRGGVGFQEQARALSSCQANVVLPWSEETIPDPNFKGAGPIYQVGSKQFTGLAAESRNFDANGQYVRSYANNANYAYLLGGDRFFLTERPLQGVNPPRKADGAPKYRPDVPCETQERPDLRSNAAAPPRMVKVDHDAPAAVERRKVASKKLLQWMEDSMQQTGLDKRFELSDEPLKAAELDDVRRTLEGGR